MKYSDRVVIESLLPEFKGVSFTIRKISHGIRSKIRQELAPVLDKIRQKTEDINALVESGSFDQKQPTDEPSPIFQLSDEAEPMLPAPVAVTVEGNSFSLAQVRIIEQIGDLNNAIEIITANDVDIVYLKHSFISISGFTIEYEEEKPDGTIGHCTINKPNYKDVFERGPEDLCLEIVAAIKAQAGLNVAVKENLGLPTTSGAAAGGPTNDITAPIADSKDTGDNETVVSISQKA